MYKIEKIPFGEETTLVKIINESTGEYFSFLPEHGASLNQLVLKGENGICHELLYEHTDYENLITEGKEIFKGSKLSPFPNRINSGEYYFNNKKYSLPTQNNPEGHAIHGLIFDKKFNIVSEEANREHGIVTVNYDYLRESEGYPFVFSIQITFELNAKGFTCSTLIKNTDTIEIPIGDGWHPYFKTSTKIDDFLLSIPSVREIDVDRNKIPTGKIKHTIEFLEPSIIGNKKLDTCYQLLDNSNHSTVTLIDEQNSLSINIWMDSGEKQYNYVQVYTPDSRNCLAIEPMTCIPDAFNNLKDLILLQPAECITLKWGVFLK